MPKNRKRILFIIDSLTIGGAEKSLLSLLSLLDLQKYHVFLWVRQRGGELEVLLPQGIELLPSPSYSTVEKLLYRCASYVYSLRFRLSRLSKRKQHLAELLWKCTGWAMKVPEQYFDVAVAYQQGIPTYLLANKIHAVKKIAWDNTNMLGAGYDMSFNRPFYAKIDGIVTVSDELQCIMQTTYPEFTAKISCVYDILSPALIRQQAQEEISDIACNNKEITLMTVGRLAPPKNYPMVVETAKILHEKSIPFQWYIVGEGNERSHIENLINEYGLQRHVKLLGARTNPYPYMNLCDIYVQTSSFEGFGLTIAEAKILGKPVVSTNFDVVHDQLQHEHNGLIADMTAASLADNIIRLINDNALRQRIINSVKAETNTTAKTEIKKVEKLLDED